MIVEPNSSSICFFTRAPIVRLVHGPGPFDEPRAEVLCRFAVSNFVLDIPELFVTGLETFLEAGQLVASRKRFVTDAGQMLQRYPDVRTLVGVADSLGLDLQDGELVDQTPGRNFDLKPDPDIRDS